MPLFDTTDDPDVWDGQTSVTLTSIRKRGSQTQTVAGCVSRQLTFKEQAASGGAYQGASLTWLLPRKHVHVGDLKQADIVEPTEGLHAGKVFIALSADLACAGAFWRLISINLSIVHDLRDEIAIERPTISYDGAGVAVLTFPPHGGREVYRNLAARVQLVSKETVEERLIEGFRGTHQITVAKQIELESYDRVKWVEGRVTYYFDIRGLREPDRIDALPVIDGELRP